MLLEKDEAQISLKQSLIMHWFWRVFNFWCLLKICGWKVVVQHTLELKLKFLLIAFWNLEADESGTSQIDIPEELSMAFQGKTILSPTLEYVLFYGIIPAKTWHPSQNDINDFVYNEVQGGVKNLTIDLCLYSKTTLPTFVLTTKTLTKFHKFIFPCSNFSTWNLLLSYIINITWSFSTVLHSRGVGNKGFKFKEK